MRYIVFILTVFIFCFKGYTQNYVADAETQEVLASVHIGYSDSKGTITNKDGVFKIPENLKLLDSIYISHIAYEPQNLAVKDIKAKDTIYLTKIPINLPEVVINSTNAKEIVLKAIQSFDDNYISTNYNLSGFFRETLTESNKGVQLIELEFLSYINPKGKSFSKVLKANRTDNYSKFNMQTVGGIASYIENSHKLYKIVDFLDVNKINLYEYYYLGNIESRNTLVHKIGFQPKDKEDLESLRKGELYIDADSFAIYDIIYSFEEEKLKKLSEKVNPEDYKTPYYFKKKIEHHVSYRKSKSGKMTLAYADSYELLQGFHKGESHFYDFSGKLVIEDIITDKPKSVRTNYNLNKDFGTAIKRLRNIENWEDYDLFPLSAFDKKVLDDIIQKQKEKE